MAVSLCPIGPAAPPPSPLSSADRVRTGRRCSAKSAITAFSTFAATASNAGMNASAT